ncbi:iron ABC transporter permease [Paenibacillus sp. P96]|uniref:Iron ABC transporter permease n=1 Tax=Paenibacillus zeirhizosphaerae TaxID=2987519 RepID=A0ABT9FMQ1_9BACL|nr:iron ABC transporter permease [Paenibacillus sp. P96]MDP4095885.1 iron ABC transporter permease [Paenibacillus sp. P96]
MRLAGIFGGGVVALLALFLLSLYVGDAPIPPSDIFEALLMPQDDPYHHSIWDIRMPRAVIGLLAGAAFAVAGVLLQTITRNPLAAADTLGINAGAYFMVVLGTVAFPLQLHHSPFVFAAAGGALAALAAYLLGGGRAAAPVRLALSGIIVSMVLGSFTAALHILNPLQTRSLFLWGAGSLEQINWSGAEYAWPWVITGLLVAFLLGRQFDVLELDESTAQSLGQRGGWIRFAGVGLSVLLAAIVVSVAGPIGFIGLLAPHLVRMAGLRAHRLVIPASALWGAVLLIAADIIARMLRSEVGELPVGAVMAAVGAPWLIGLVLRKLKGITTGSAQPSVMVGGSAARMRFVPLALVLLVLLLTFILVSFTLGSTRIPLNELWGSLIGADSTSSYSILLNLRMPRILVAAVAGFALAVSGVLIQSAIRNPLADSWIIGAAPGAGLGALLLIVVWPQVPFGFLPVAAIAGAVTAASIVLLLAWRKSLQPSVLILLGIAVSAAASAGIQALLVRGSFSGNKALIWINGSTYARGWQDLLVIVCFIAVLLPVSWTLGRKFDVLAFSDESSTGLGLQVRRTRLLAMAAGVLLAAGAVSSVGTIGFVGLMAPHAARLLIGHRTRHLLILSGLLGAVLLVLADTIGRILLAPKEIPSGLMISLIGSPYFLFLMYRSMGRK